MYMGPESATTVNLWAIECALYTQLTRQQDINFMLKRQTGYGWTVKGEVRLHYCIRTGIGNARRNSVFEKENVREKTEAKIY